MSGPEKDFKTYLGDGVYADFDGCNIVLTTENGVSVTNTIYLEPNVVDTLIWYLKKRREEAGQ